MANARGRLALCRQATKNESSTTTIHKQPFDFIDITCISARTSPAFTVGHCVQCAGLSVP